MSEGRFPFPVKDDERIARRRRRQALGHRQAPAADPAAPELGSEDSVSEGVSSASEDESSSSGASGQPQAQPPPPASSISATRNRITMTAILPPAQSSLMPGFSSSQRQIPTLTAILPPAQSSLLTQVSSTSSPTSITQTTSAQNVQTSGQASQDQLAATKSPTSLASASLPLSTSSSVASTPPAAIPGIPVGIATSASIALTTATSLISSLASTAPTARVATSASALGEIKEVPFQGSHSKDDKRLSKLVETVIIVASVGAAFALIAYFFFMYYQKSKRRKLEADASAPNNTRSLWGGSEPVAGQGAPQMASTPATGPLPTYHPPPLRQQAPSPDENPFSDPNPDPRRRSALSNNTADRQERLVRVRADLLAPRELTGGLMRSVPQGQRNLPEPNRGHIRKASGNNILDYPPPLRVGNVFPEARVDGNDISRNQRLDIEAGGQWDDSVTIARYSTAETERSIPHWRTPSQWVTDQANRSQGMNRLPG
ncbi:hypothetical protein WAI453_012241 [Rhynchosporium graminicola]|uniref:Uncharacterized protein n=1 Tax=Rhynchosporium graminicola TaxID=2792576 RepID=A0A1E1KXR8_9HELO|nr:uncharacterized protein RCO7_06072 [Rhynchosporium commune]